MARAQLLRFVVSLINLNDSVSFLEIRESKSNDGNQILCNSSVFCLKTTSIHWTGNTDTPTERTGAVMIGAIIECVTIKALSLTTDQQNSFNSFRWNCKLDRLCDDHEHSRILVDIINL